MAFPGLRVMAGYSLNEGYHLERGRVEPSDSLKKQLFPFVDEALDELRAHYENTEVMKKTAKCFLTVLKNQRRIILQDLAAQLADDSSRGDHYIFQMPVFQTGEWKVSSFLAIVDFRFSTYNLFYF
jgi:hypothetical protein